MTALVETDHRRPRVRAALRVAAIVGIEAACVVVLHQLGRYPWMRIDWSDLGHWLETSAPEDVLLGVTRTVALALAWWLLVSSLLYVGAATTGAPRAMSWLRWALLPVVRRVLDGALALSLTGSAAVSSTAAAPAIASVAAEAGAIHPPAARPPEAIALKLAIYRAAAPLPAPGNEAFTYEVQPGDSLWEIAERRLGDPMRWTEIWELNRARLEASGATSPHVLHVGWVLELPSPADAPTDPRASYTVQPGDTLWSIADRELHDPARIGEIVALNVGRTQPDGGVLTNPDLIRPGWQLDIPTRSEDEPGPVPTPASPAPPEPVVEPEPQPPADPMESEAPPASAPGRTVPAPDADDPRPSGTEPPQGAELPSTPAPPEAGHGPERNTAEPDAPPALPVVAGVTGATVLATGLMLHLRRMRRRRATTSARVRSTWRRRPAEVEEAIVAAADVPLVRWAGQELAALATRLRARDLDGAAPVAVELSTDAGIELLWDRPAPYAPRSTQWSVRDGGWAWSLPYDPDAPVPADTRPAPLPALVTIGEREGRQLLLDLEGYGSVAVTGDPQRVVDFGRAVGLELATDEDLADAVVSTVGVEIPGADQLVRLTPASSAGAHGALRATVTSVGHTIEQARLGSSFELRVGRDAPHLEAVVVIADEHAPGIVPAELIATSPARRGAATVLLGDAEASGRIVIASDGSARLDPLGVEFHAAALPSPGREQVDQLLVQEAASGQAPPRADGQPEAPPDTVVDSATGGNGHRPPSSDAEPGAARLLPAEPVGTIADSEPRRGAVADAAELDPRHGRILVRVLGPPRVDERPELRRRELALVVYLACRGAPVHASSIQHAIWGGQAVQDKTLWNLITRTRATIGVFDGEPALPPADRSRNTLALSNRLTTDLAVFRWLYERAIESPSAQAIELLREALALTEGEPFDAPGYDWAHHDHQYVAEASALIEQAVEHLVDLATQAGDVEVARDALVRGLRGLPGNEVLYRARMRLEHDAGNLAGVKSAWDELVGYLDDLYTEPSEATELLYRELVRITRR